jgi:hypothetical protein
MYPLPLTLYTLDAVERIRQTDGRNKVATPFLYDFRG